MVSDAWHYVPELHGELSTPGLGEASPRPLTIVGNPLQAEIAESRREP